MDDPKHAKALEAIERALNSTSDALFYAPTTAHYTGELGAVRELLKHALSTAARQRYDRG